MARRGSVNTAGKPRATSLKGHMGTPGQKAAAKPHVVTTGKTARTGH